MNMLNKRLADGRFLLGAHVNGCDPSLTELMGQCGFDYLWIDTEHTAIDYHTLQMHLIAAKAAGCPAIVRVPWNETYLAKRVLEQGPDGIVFPSINSAEEAKRAMDACFYPPTGMRGYGPIRATGYGLTPMAEYIAKADDFCRFIQVEHVSAVSHLEEILEVPGIDGVILGPCDLSGSIGRLGETECFVMRELIDRTIKICGERKVPVGVSLGLCGAEEILDWRRRGIQFLSAGSEYSYILQGASRLAACVKKNL
ncbi:MAG: aldolase [Lachnospiraceae bacterium]|nr:aldolase [Lachnospiraceae bacterium]